MCLNLPFNICQQKVPLYEIKNIITSKYAKMMRKEKDIAEVKHQDIIKKGKDGSNVWIQHQNNFF